MCLLGENHDVGKGTWAISDQNFTKIVRTVYCYRNKGYFTSFLANKGCLFPKLKTPYLCIYNVLFDILSTKIELIEKVSLLSTIMTWLTDIFFGW